MPYAKMRPTLIVLICLAASTRVAVADCEGEHCHATTPDPDKTISLFWLMGDSCFKIGEYNPFFEEEKNSDFCPVGTELYWKHPDDMTPDEKKAMGIADLDIEEMKRQGVL